MTNFVKAFAVAAALFAGAQSISTASAETNGSSVSCMTGSLTPHGSWDCR